MSTVPRSQLARSSVVGSTAVKIGLGKLKTKAKRPFLSHENSEAADQEQLNSEAELLFKAITQLRGTAVKLAQFLGMETELLPERVRKELAKSYHQVPPLNRVLVGKVIENEFGSRPDKLFKCFDPEAIAAASLGQVHQAELDNGTSVAVKIQYPGIHQTIESDFKLLRKIAPQGINLLPKSTRPTKEVLDNAITEVESRLQEETNYLLEAENTQWFANNLQIDGIQVPCVYENYCSNRVITTELLTGVHIDQWLETKPSQAVRNQAAQRLQSLFRNSIIKHGRIHADPNPGNYLFKPDGRVGLIDFGCIKTFSNQFVEHLPSLLASICNGDIDHTLKTYESIGMVISTDLNSDMRDSLAEFTHWIAHPFMTESFDFKENNTYTNQAHELMQRLNSMPTVEKIQEDLIFFERTSYGLFKIFERLEATVDLRTGWNLPAL